MYADTRREVMASREVNLVRRDGEVSRVGR